ncbi:CobW/HypB/UreG, nucleotide-binding domain-containing protein [Filobasidium floriforme]|uniref:CobW/HypB/UreG, nucleotide-binding domain-containing protein n=1 Tax=Filobasidium floriforme TaxID=5210 RepID=UPI001E8D5AB8|nr:CobW/HypB/UreG, nucleotide-binding domain-containing protein [Filobasidium floriforme]KAH8089755.1 CobW/HypB/UreG, nucleotide-binding domain-containing protein [Filobasidium floriforme]
MTDTSGDRIALADAISVTCFTGFLGAGKTSTILGLLGELPKDYRVVLLKNEYGDVEVDSLIAKESSIAGVSEILNGCLCCTLVGQIQNAMLEIKEKMNPDRIIIESSGSAFPATLAIKVRELAPQGFKLDSVATVIDCVNFKGYEDSSPTAKIQAKYTDCLLLNKYDLVSERELDSVLDHLYELNDETPMIRVSKSTPLKPELVFGLDTKLFERGSDETADWDMLGADGKKESHMNEIETRSVWKGGVQPGKGKKRLAAGDGHAHEHDKGQKCDCDGTMDAPERAGEGEEVPVDLQVLEAGLKKLPFEVYRVKGFLRLRDQEDSAIHVYALNWAFGRFELTLLKSLDTLEDLKGVSLRLTMMGARGEVMVRARKLAEILGAQCA